jgi:chemotaxis signal transduction protein
MNYYLKFAIERIKFGVPIDEVIEIARPKSVRRLDKVKKDIAGVFELRKNTCVLYDLAAFLEIGSAQSFEVIVSRINAHSIGFKVDKVLGIVPSATLTPFPEIFGAGRYFEGVIKEDEDLVQVLSLKRIISGTRLRRIKTYIKTLNNN